MRVTIVAATLLLSGCASSASGVMAVRPTEDFSRLSCAEAQTRLTAADARVAELSRRQDSASRRDTAGVALVGLPVGSIFGGNVAADLGAAKGEQEALRERMNRGCLSGG